MKSSLAAPCDLRSKSKSYPTRQDKKVEPLDDANTVNAKNALYQNTAKFLKIDRGISDPVILQQKYCLVSFTPSTTAKPDEDGIFGMIKFRGAFRTVQEASDYAEDLIRNHDSYNKIYTAYVGKPFPATQESKFSEMTQRVDINKKCQNIQNQHVMAKREQEKNDLKIVKQREKKMMEESDLVEKENKGLIPKRKKDPLENYIELRVKRAQLITFVRDYDKKMKHAQSRITKAEKEIKELEKAHPDIKKKHTEKYKKARESSGLKMDNTGFLKFLNDDIK